MKVRNTPW